MNKINLRTSADSFYCFCLNCITCIIGVRFGFMVLLLQHKGSKCNLHNLSLFVVLKISEVLNTILPLIKYRGT